MTIHLISTVYFEEWDYRNSVESGIGGSETSQCELAWRLAKRGHEVYCYAPIPKDCIRNWRGTQWLHLDEIDYTKPGLWIIYRNPSLVDKFEPQKNNQQLWIMCQDENYPGQFTEERIVKIDKVLALCQTHAKHLAKNNLGIAPKIYITTNGIKLDLLKEVEQENIIRNPHKLIWASSPDRGLHTLLKIFKKAREYIDNLELHIFYGFDNIDKLIKFNSKFKFYIKKKEEIQRLLDQPGVFWRGRVDQPTLYREMLSAGIWCYSSNFSETSCIQCMENQACGAIPITNPYWALSENVKHGIFIDGDAYGDLLIQCKYVAEIVRLASNEQLQQQIRVPMMEWSRIQFNWERAVDSIESLMYGLENHAQWHTQFNFQLKHAKRLGGRILNIGCDFDPAEFKKLGATNLDINETSPILGVKTAANVITDTRSLPFNTNSYDTIVYGDILEHMYDTDIVMTLKEGKRVLSENGRIIITCPNDTREVSVQHKGGTTKEQYCRNISCYHERPISKKHLFNLIKQSNLETELYQEIDYSHFFGHGIICK